MMKEATLSIESFEDQAIIELPSREAMTGLGLSLCISIEVSVGVHGGNGCRPKC